MAEAGLGLNEGGFARNVRTTVLDFASISSNEIPKVDFGLV
jgi:hypothetical protein